jgi:Mrp family chromosome partitioning ATPase
MAQLAQSTAQLLAFPGVSLGAALTPALRRHRLPERLIEALVREAALLPPSGIDQTLTKILAARMKLQPLALFQSSRIVLIGPSGTGKSSVAAKLAQSAARSGAVVEICDSKGFNPNNPRARSAFGCIGEREDVQTIGVVSALADAEEVSETIANFHLSRIIVTGLDMARRFGALTAAVTQGAALAHVTRSAKDDAPLENISGRELANLLLN